MISEKNVQRLILYRKILIGLQQEGLQGIHSHTLGKYADSSPAQVRRDLMAIGYSGTPVHGYKVHELVSSISEFLNNPLPQKTCIIGLGNLGRAILDYCHQRNDNIPIMYAFEKDKAKVGKVIHGCKCISVADLEDVIEKEGIELAIITIPAMDAQFIAERLVNSGIRGILNYSPVELRLPDSIYVENRDMLLALEKVAYFSR